MLGLVVRRSRTALILRYRVGFGFFCFGGRFGVLSPMSHLLATV